MAKDNFINAQELVDRLTKALYEHSDAIAGAATQMQGLNKQWAKVPSDYTRSLKEIETNQNNIAKSSERVRKATKSVTDEVIKERVETQKSNQQARQRAVISSKLSTEYERQSAKLAQLRRAYKDLATRQEIHNNLTKQEVAEMKRLEIQANKIDGALKKVDASVGQNQRSVGNYGMAFTKLTSIVKAAIVAFGLYSGIQIAQQIFQQIKMVDQLNKSLLKVVGTQESFNVEQNYLSSLAEEAGVELEGLTRSYIKFLASAKTTKLTMAETRDIFRQTAKAGAVLGLTTDDINGSFRALEQMLSKGKVQAEEIRGQLGERLPGAFQILAQSMGLTTAELSKQLELGNVYSEEVLPKFARELEKVYGLDMVNKVETLTAAQNRLGNAWIEFVMSVENGEGVISQSLKWIFDGISNVIKEWTLMNQTAYDTQEAGMYASTIKEIGSIAKATGRTEKEVAEARINQTQEMLLKEEERLAQQEKAIELLESNIKRGRHGITSSKEGINLAIKEAATTKANISIYKGQVAALNELINTKEEDVYVSETGTEKIKESTTNAHDVWMAQMAAEIDMLKDIAANDKLTISKRIVANEMLRQKQIEVANAVREDALKKEGLNKYDLQLIEQKHVDTLFDINKVYNDRVLSLAEKAIEDRKKYYEKELKDVEAFMTESASIELTALREQLLNKEITVEEFEKRSKDLQINAAKEVAILKLDLLEKQLQAEKKLRPDQDFSKAEQAISDARRKIHGMEVDAFILKENERLDKIKEVQRETDELLMASFGRFGEALGINGSALYDFYNAMSKMAEKGISDFDKMKMAVQSVAGVMIEVINGIANAQNERIERHIERLEQEKDIQLEFAGDSAAARGNIEERYAEKKRKLQEKQARNTKAAALMEAVVAAASAVVEALPNIPLSIIVGALGLAEIAIIASTPIPKFEKGVRDFEGGTAIINEKRQEVVRTKDGRVSRPKGKNLVVNLPKHADVFKSEADFQRQLDRELSVNGISSPKQEKGITALDMEMAMRRAIGSNKGDVITLDKKGFTTYQINQMTKNKILNNRVTFRGKIV